MIIYGTAFHVGDDVTTDLIISPQDRADDPAILAAHCLAAIDPAIAEQVHEGDVVLAGWSFGSGPDPDMAALSLRALGFGAVICSSAAASFVEAAAACALPVLTCPEAAARIAQGTVVRIDLESGRIDDRATGEQFSAPPPSPEVRTAVRGAQLLSRMRQVVEEEGFDG